MSKPLTPRLDKIKEYDKWIDNLATTVVKESNIHSCQDTTCKVSFYLPSYNSEETIEASLNSLFYQQTQDAFCVTVLDDASSDSTRIILNRLLYKHSNLRVYTMKRNVGIIAATKLARYVAERTCSNSRYLSLASDHDYWAPNYLSVLSDILDQDDKASLVTCSSRIGEFGKKERVFLLSDQLSSPAKIKAMRPGHWIYGLERKGLIPNSLFYAPVVGPDQLYIYLHHILGKIRFDDKIRLVFRWKEAPTSGRRLNLMSLPYNAKYFQESNGKTSRLLSHLSAISSSSLSSTRIKLLYVMVFIQKNLGVRSKLIFSFKNWNLYARRLLRISLNVLRKFRTTSLRTANILSRGFWHKLTTSFVYRNFVVDGLDIKPTNSSRKRVGIYITSAGIIRLLDQAFRETLLDSKIDLVIFLREETFRKKMQDGHLSLLRQFEEQYGNRFQCILIPKTLSLLISRLSFTWGLDEQRLIQNQAFYDSNSFLAMDKVSKNRAIRVADSRVKFLRSVRQSMPRVLRHKRLRVRRIKSKRIYNFFDKFKLDVICLAPVVNHPETEIIAINMPRGLVKVGIVISWDNLTIKGQLQDFWDCYFVWGEGQKELIEKFHHLDTAKRVDVLGPYPFTHLVRQGGGFESMESWIGLWVFSSGFITRTSDLERDTSEFQELNDVADFLSFLKRSEPSLLTKFHFRLHPNSLFDTNFAREYLESKLEQPGILFQKQFSKFEPLLSAERAQYLEILSNSKVLIGYATTSIVEGAFLGKGAVAPPTTLAMRSYELFWHGRLLLSDSGGPVKRSIDWSDFIKKVMEESSYTPSGQFAKFLGLSIAPTLAVKNFASKLADYTE